MCVCVCVFVCVLLCVPPHQVTRFVPYVSAWSRVSLQLDPPWMDSMAVEYSALWAAGRISSPPAGEPWDCRSFSARVLLWTPSSRL